ncbi:MAG: N-acetylneuraminate synthase family protein [Ferrovibrio sp.]|uniref:N-acetylneuraminate synthase family protein n=1 Tax=Ferrovibrio sp. TaxID=1917215 RepID=UPI00260D683B|nr:N-acetylneuraminate synthase family protein [Ferrovibrio sp.]MCW0234922.1 N-acetylneuraminate synthase family protein [Ferrovibrio sp.]
MNATGGKTIKIGNRLIGAGQPAYIIAEISQNHCGELSKAKELVDAAKEIGCDSAKFQTFTTELFCADRSKMFTYRSQGRDVTESEYELHKRYEFTPDQWAELVAYCEKRQIQFLTTIQDPINLELMLTLGLCGIKIGSDDFDHVENLRIYARSGLPLLLSKGMAALGEVDRIVRVLRAEGAQAAIMHCVSLYPTGAENLNLRQIQTLQKLYPDIVWGFSDHSQGPLASTLAVTLGAKVIEKHFTLDHNLPGPDHWFSMDVGEMAQLVRDVRFAEAAMGSGDVVPAAAELAERSIRRRRVVARKNLKPGDMLDEQSVTFKRASNGLFVSEWDLVRGTRLRAAKQENEGIDLADIAFETSGAST